jgi:Anti-sigma factor NepR
MVKAGRGSESAPDKKKGKKMQAGTEQRSSENARPRIDPRVQREIGKHLRAHYDEVIKEPVPDKFIELLEQLEQSVTRKS